MANVVRFFMAPEDEKAFLREIAPFGLELYPDLVPPDYRAPKADETLAGTLDEDSYYLAAVAIGPVTVDKVKRGPNKGKWTILEVVSPVIHWERSRVDEDGVLRSGRLWAELQVSGDVQKRVQKSAQFETLFRKLEEVVRRRAHRSDPPGYHVEPGAAAAFKAGTELREAGRKGEPIKSR
jgi:hypothetical protein